MVDILIVDDHEVVRRGLRSLLELQEDFKILGEAGTADEAVEFAKNNSPQVVLMDVRLPGKSGVEACKNILSLKKEIKVLMLTSYANDQEIYDSIVAGASGYILKEVNGEELIDGIKKVAKGETLLDPLVAEVVFNRVKSMAEAQKVQDKLNKQEKKILELLGEGKTNKEIADELFLAEKTVRNYVSKVFTKIKVKNRTQAVVYVTKNNMEF